VAVTFTDAPRATLQAPDAIVVPLVGATPGSATAVLHHFARAGPAGTRRAARARAEGAGPREPTSGPVPSAPARRLPAAPAASG
jgi:hypothetical protein